MSGSFARSVMRQLQLRDIQKALRFGRLHSTRRTLFTPRAAGTVCGASLALFRVYRVANIKGPKTEFIKFTDKANMRRFKQVEVTFSRSTCSLLNNGGRVLVTRGLCSTNYCDTDVTHLWFDNVYVQFLVS